MPWSPGSAVIQYSSGEIGKDCASESWLLFGKPCEIVAAQSASDVLPALNQIEKKTQSGYWAAGFISYEASEGLDDAFRVCRQSAFPLLWFGIYDQPVNLPILPSLDEIGEFELGDWMPSIGWQEYKKRIQGIKEYIASGHTYQVNYTYRLHSSFVGDPWSLFLELHKAQRGSTSAFILMDDFAIISASPELFFRQEGNRITCRPMKGTAPRGRWVDEDEIHINSLKTSPKERAENVMIVDLIRNDLGKIARSGGVNVVSLFDVEKYETIFQMTSTVTAETSVSPVAALKSLFPCGSVTGAPKIRTMQIIAEIESEPRGIYTGAIGFISPNGLAHFNVAIRTICVDLKNSKAVYGVGGGITWDSKAEREYEETIAKSQLLFERQPEFDLFETILWEPDYGFFLEDRHLERLRKSAHYFGFHFDEQGIRDALQAKDSELTSYPHRIRLILSRDGTIRIESSPVDNKHERVWRIGFSPQPVDSRDPFLFHKTTNRKVYDDARSLMRDFDEAILWNRKGEITEGTITNIVVELGDGLWTPPRICGLLAGTFRDELIAQGIIAERILTKEDMFKAQKIWLINSIRRWIETEFDGQQKKF